MYFYFFNEKKTTLEKEKKDKFTVAFYNLENLFDTIDDPNTDDDDFTPEGKKNGHQEDIKRK